MRQNRIKETRGMTIFNLTGDFRLDRCGLDLSWYQQKNHERDPIYSMIKTREELDFKPSVHIQPRIK